MPTAYLIFAHHQPRHLGRLVDALQDPDAGFFIHIDAKVDEEPFRKAVGAARNVVFLQKRHVVHWGGFSQVEATLAALREAWRSDRAFHRFCLLSGSDYPIKSNKHILRAFSTAKEFMRVDRSVGASMTNLHTENVRFFWFMDAWGPIRRRLSKRLRRKPYDKIELYQGSNWWALTRDCIEYIVDFISAHRDYRSFFKYVHCGDEIFFHSIVKQWPFSSQITHDFETATDLDAFYLNNDHGCHYIDWNTVDERLPKVLDLADRENLCDSNALFARKFDGPRSETLIAELQSKLAEEGGLPG